MSRSKYVAFSTALTTVFLLGWTSEAGAQYPWWGPYPYPPYRFDPGAAMRLEVKPKEAEVYVDGYYAGVVDDFNGVFQRLRLPPGEHEIVLYRDGYRTAHQKVYLTPDHTFRLRLEMEPLAAGEQPESRPHPTAPSGPGGGPGGGTVRENPRGAPPMYPPGRGPGGRRVPQPLPSPPAPPPAAPNQPAGAPTGAFGTLSVRVQPSDAEVIVDGGRWRGVQGQEPLTIDLPAGRHSIQIQKAGYRSYVTEIDVRRGETTPLNVSLHDQDQS